MFRFKGFIIQAAIFSLWAPALVALDIHDAAKAGDLAKVKAIIEREPGLIGAKDETGRTPLHWACRGVHVDVVKYLVERGADVNAQDRSSITPLHSVASRGHLEAARVLVGAGAGLEARTAAGATPLHMAAAQGRPDAAAFLFERGARLNVQDGNEDTPLLAAAWEGKWEVVDRLTEMMPTEAAAVLNQRDFDGNTVLHLAARAGRPETMRRLVSKGAGLDNRNSLGQTAYNLAGEGGFDEAAAFLALKGADRSLQKFPALSGPYMGQTPPGAAPKLFAKGIVSRRNGMYGTITFSPDGREAFWKPEPPYEEACMKIENGLWSPPRRIPFKAPDSIDVPFFSADGRRLYFMNGTRNAQGRVEKEAIWFVEKTEAGWAEPKPFDPIVNSINMHWQFALDKRGNVYYGGIWRARFENGRYLAPELLPAPIHVEHSAEDKYRAGEIGPFISPEGDYLIYTQMRIPLPSRLLISFRGKDGTWSEPRDLSEKLKTGGSDSSDSMARVTPDGKYLFFQSNRSDSGVSRGLYWVDARVIEEMRPAPSK